jgi:alpha-L-arabinofuranosidase
LSEDRKTLSIAVLNPSDSEQSIRSKSTERSSQVREIVAHGSGFKIDATVQVDKKPEVQVEEQTLGALPDTITVRPFSVNIYSYPVQ